MDTTKYGTNTFFEVVEKDEVMVEFRRPDTGQLFILSVVPLLLIYHIYIREVPPTDLELTFSVVLYGLLVVASVIRGGIQSVYYLLVGGSLIAAFSSVLYLRSGDIVDLALLVVGVLMFFRGVQLRIRRSSQSS
ncbi:hypothetical protein C453_11476 [Haloferax elongans ATCC BAA-1513]|uniref:Uncharacterized protein n=1 Tax=Haloferax elongans ATCC BAA-1513 TaxID=1230453 RepID=M0HLP0_HALEO|nr:hypothetical protein C453_11476 [Haloferax elongans ATCC BAA-1513]